MFTEKFGVDLRHENEFVSDISELFSKFDKSLRIGKGGLNFQLVHHIKRIYIDIDVSKL